MADQLRLTIYNNIVKKAGVKSGYSSGYSFGKANLNSKEEQLLVGLLNKNSDSSSVKSGYTEKTPYASSSVGTKASVNGAGNLPKASSAITSIGAKVSVGTTSFGANVSLGSSPSGNKIMQKVNLEDLAGKAPKKENTYVKRNNTAMTLDELALKCKKTATIESSQNRVKDEKKGNTSYSGGVTVKSSVIGNASSIESLIPKISLNSIGKSNSFLK